MYFIIWSFLEIYIYTQAVEYFGFLQATFFYLLPSFFALSLVAFFGQRFMLLQSQFRGVQDQSKISKKLLHQGAILLACLLMLIPALLPRVISLVLLLPGFRHLILFLGKNWFFRKMQSAGNFSYQFGSFGAGSAPYGPTEERPVQESSGSVERIESFSSRSAHHGEVIDVKPIGRTED